MLRAHEPPRYIVYLGGGLLVNILCGAIIGGIVAVTLRHRMRFRSMAILIGITCALVVGVSLAVIARTHGEGLSFYSAGLILSSIPFSTSSPLDFSALSFAFLI
jgi:hypothetical protein